MESGAPFFVIDKAPSKKHQMELLAENKLAKKNKTKKSKSMTEAEEVSEQAEKQSKDISKPKKRSRESENDNQEEEDEDEDDIAAENEEQMQIQLHNKDLTSENEDLNQSIILPESHHKKSILGYTKKQQFQENKKQRLEKQEFTKADAEEEEKLEDMLFGNTEKVIQDLGLEKNKISKQTKQTQLNSGNRLKKALIGKPIFLYFFFSSSSFFFISTNFFYSLRK